MVGWVKGKLQELRDIEEMESKRETKEEKVYVSPGLQPQSI